MGETTHTSADDSGAVARLEHDDAARLARVVDIIGRTILAGALVALVVERATSNGSSTGTVVAIAAGTVLALLLNRLGRSKAAVYLTVGVVEAGACGLVAVSGLGLHGVAMSIFPGTLVVAALLLDSAAFAWTALATVAFVVSLGLAELGGLVASRVPGLTNAASVIDSATIVVLTAVAAGLLAGSLKSSLARARVQESSLAVANVALLDRAGELQASEERFRSLVELAVDPIFLADAEGRLLGANRRATELTGYSPDELRGRDLERLLVRDDGRPSSLAADLPADGTPLGAELLLRRRDGASVPVEASAKRMPDGSSQLFLRDTTERRKAAAERSRLEAQLQQAQKMEAVGRVAGGMAHDFNNVLMVVRSSAAVARRDASVSPRVARCLYEIDQASERAAVLTSQLMAFSRKREIAPRRIDLGELVCGLRPMLARLLGSRIRLEIVPSGEPALVEVDPVQTEHVLLNLAMNAREAMPNGGTVCVAISTAQIDGPMALGEGLAAGPHVVLAITDSGCGMPATVRERAFEPFFTTKEEGTGLGLAIVYGAVRQNHGAVHVDSEPGHGTTFRILLPRVGPSLAAPAH